jgi:L-seryl-tRNA(Ser) seleniumtransferase
MGRALAGAHALETRPVSLRQLPSVDLLLRSAEAEELQKRYGRPLTLDALRRTLEAARRDLSGGCVVPDSAALIAAARQDLDARLAPTLRAVINATGVVLHTNLGRAPLSPAALQAELDASAGYSTLEFDLTTGRRGQRHIHAESLLTQITGAEAALVVNNNAGAVLLALTALAARKDVLIARSQLVEIGGGFRIPDVLRQSGARLVEVGTTNRTHLADFAEAITPRTACLLRAHPSNFRLVGFTAEPDLAELAALAHDHGVLLVDDLGSGALLDTAAFGLAHEPTVQESLHAGADLVAFSGDKLLGGPQAGILAGKAALVEGMRKHPLARALRPGKSCLAALAATLLHYLRDEALTAIPVWRMIALPPEAIHARAAAWAASLGAGEVIAGLSTIGGGSLPEESQPTWLLSLSVAHPDQAAARLRQAEPPVIVRIEKHRLTLDPRTVLPEQDTPLLAALRQMLAATSSTPALPRS